jgi:chemotaxis protein CheD
LISTVNQNILTEYLYPCGLVAFVSPRMVHTILGSCVSVCLFDHVRKNGGINHFMLPVWNGEGLATPKYGNIAIERLINTMFSLGSKKEHLVAKVFGGAAVIESSTPTFQIGEKNCAIALSLLEEFRIPVIAKSTGGKLGRKIVYNTGSGEVVQRYVNSGNFK